MASNIAYSETTNKTSKNIGNSNPIYIYTEEYPRPPYSGATYFFYESEGAIICTKLEVCNKFGECGSDYWKGKHKEEVDNSAFSSTSKVLIPKDKLKKHRCLTKFNLTKQ